PPLGGARLDQTSKPALEARSAAETGSGSKIHEFRAASEPYRRAHTPVGPGINAAGQGAGPGGRAHACHPWPQCSAGSGRGRLCLTQERTSAHTPQPLITMPRPRGLAFGSPFLWQRGAGVWGFVDEGRESPASRVAAHTPRRREQPRENRHHPHKEKCAGVAPKRVARRPGRAKLPDPDEHPTPAPQETPRPQPTTHPTHSLPTPPRHHKKPHNPNPDEPPAVIS